METTPDINFVRFRSKFLVHLTPKKQIREAISHLGAIVSGTTLIASIAGYGALMLGRDVPTALALGAAGSVGLAANTKLKEH
jgi:hypothetical protein